MSFLNKLKSIFSSKKDVELIDDPCSSDGKMIGDYIEFTNAELIDETEDVELSLEIINTCVVRDDDIIITIYECEYKEDVIALIVKEESGKTSHYFTYKEVDDTIEDESPFVDDDGLVDSITQDITIDDAEINVEWNKTLNFAPDDITYGPDFWGFVSEYTSDTTEYLYNKAFALLTGEPDDEEFDTIEFYVGNEIKEFEIEFIPMDD